MMFVDLLHTWIASERGGTEQTCNLLGGGALGQVVAGARAEPVPCRQREIAACTPRAQHRRRSHRKTRPARYVRAGRLELVSILKQPFRADRCHPAGTSGASECRDLLALPAGRLATADSDTREVYPARSVGACADDSRSGRDTN